MNKDGADAVELGGEPASIDANVVAHLLKGSRIVFSENHGISFWASTRKITVELPEGTPQALFLKVLSKHYGEEMVRSEFESAQAIAKVLPDFVPRPIAWGQYERVPDTYFYLCEFRAIMSDEVPDPQQFTKRLAELHQKSTSPTRKFGFDTMTFSGNLPQWTEWETSWEIFFAKNMRKALDLEIGAKGYDPGFDTLLPALFDTVISCLLCPLESEGRSVKPYLVHGDLWYANAGVDALSGEPFAFDACCFYAHNEYEFGQWRPVCNKFGQAYLDAYHSYVPISPPDEDYDGRLDLYKLFNTHVSALFKDNAALREQMLGDLSELVRRYV